MNKGAVAGALTLFAGYGLLLMGHYSPHLELGFIYGAVCAVIVRIIID